MKSILLVFLLVTTSFIFAQNKISVVEYSIIIGNDDTYKNDMLENYYNDAKKNSNYLKYTLKFDKQNAVFNEVATSGELNNDLSFARAFSECAGTYYTFLNKPYYLNKPEANYGDNILIKTNSFVDWKLKNEKKIVNGFVCYKATGFKKVANLKGVYNHPIIAWYCPKLPYSFGPLGFGNLPGLILELQIKKIVYGVEKISINTSDKTNLNFNSNKKIISETQFNSIIEKSHD